MPDSYSKENQSRLLSVLSNASADQVAQFTDRLLADLPDVNVLENRTGLVMVPYTDTRKGATFHMGEVLVAEGRVKINDSEGYGACLGRDTQHALAIAILDAACQQDLHTDKIQSFVLAMAEDQAAAEADLLRKVEATRVEMETY